MHNMQRSVRAKGVTYICTKIKVLFLHIVYRLVYTKVATMLKRPNPANLTGLALLLWAASAAEIEAAKAAKAVAKAVEIEAAKVARAARTDAEINAYIKYKAAKKPKT